MALTGPRVRTAKHAEEQQKLYDGGGLLLLTTPADGRRWVPKCDEIFCVLTDEHVERFVDNRIRVEHDAKRFARAWPATSPHCVPRHVLLKDCLIH
jgi:hypothetical protein